MRVALVHDWLEGCAGAERVLEQLILMYPQADLFTLVDHLQGSRAWLRGKMPRTSFIQRLPLSRRFFRYYLPLFLLAVRRFDLSGYDVILSSSHCIAKNVRVRAGQRHICYCHTPMRYAWAPQSDARLPGPLRAYLRWVDKYGGRGVTHFVANSRHIAARIRRCYGREATVVYPPVDITRFKPAAKRGGFYVTVSRLVPYKNIPAIAAAFAAMPDKQLVIIGAGPNQSRVCAAAREAANIRVLGAQSDAVVKQHLDRAKAFVFAANEDFGIAPVEALAAGCPVIALGKGGVTETMTPATGLFFAEPAPQAIIGAVNKFDREIKKFRPAACRAQAQKFSVRVFRRNFARLVETTCSLKAKK